MKSEALKLAKIKLEINRESQIAETLRELMRNPVAELLVLYVVVEILQSRKIIPNVAGTIMETAGVSAITIQQIAPLVPYIAQAGSDIMGAVAKIAPAALAAGV